jgi:hypothetical protein
MRRRPSVSFQSSPASPLSTARSLRPTHKMSLFSSEFFARVSQAFFQSAYSTKWTHASRKDFAIARSPLPTAVKEQENFDHMPKALRNNTLNHMFWKVVVCFLLFFTNH